MTSPVSLNGESLTLEEVERVARDGARVAISRKAMRKMERSRDSISRIIASGRPVYGVTTGFGSLANVRVDEREMGQLQLNLIRSHTAGTGEPFSEEVTRAIILLRAHVLSMGCSGVRPGLVKAMVELLNKRVHPVIPEQGSVGASGDLAPLAHLGAALIGEGEAIYDGKAMPAGKALKRAGLSPFVLGPKEGLAIINGTEVMTAQGVLTLLRAERLVKTADIAGCMTLEALMGTAASFDHRIHDLRPHRGQRDSARNLSKLMRGSLIAKSHKLLPHEVQDAYSLRCMPQVHGAVRDALRHVRGVLETEVNSVTDNPLVISEGDEVLMGGNFHGEPVALALDYMTMALSELGSISERRIERLVNPALSNLPPFLTPSGGLNSGYMLLQIAAASLASENKVLSHPASLDSIPTSANKEDHVSMGCFAARKGNDVLMNVERIIAFELLAAAQGLDFLSPLRPGPGVEAAWSLVRSKVPKLVEDRNPGPDMEAVLEMVVSGSLIRAAEAAVGPLH